MADNEEPLPEMLAEIASMVGRDAALKIASARGGTQIYLPGEPAPDHWLSELIGHDLAVKLGAELAMGRGIRLEVPLGPASGLSRFRTSVNMMVDDMLREGRSVHEIAIAAGVSARTIRRRRSRLAELPV